jgi:hypothetical protein
MLPALRSLDTLWVTEPGINEMKYKSKLNYIQGIWIELPQ